MATYVPQPSTSSSTPISPTTPPVDDEDWPPTIKVLPRVSTWDKFSRKFIEEPFVPLGILATCVALGGATSALQKGNRTQFNKFLRARVAAQGVTVVAALGGSIYYSRERKAKRDQEKALKEAAATGGETVKLV